MFYRATKYPYIFIYETKAIATSASKDLGPRFGDEHDNVLKIAERWSQKLGSKVLYSNPGDMIFCVSKDGFDEYSEIWNVIINDKIGWILLSGWCKIGLVQV